MNRFICRSALALALALATAGCSAPSAPDAPASDYRERGQASYYADKYQSKKTASGERYDRSALTAAHRKLPFGTRVKVTNLRNNKSVVVRVNDRGPFVKGRVIDLSRAAFERIGSTRSGVIDVTVEVVK